MSDSVYHCSYCDTTITKSSTPSAGGCSKSDKTKEKTEIFTISNIYPNSDIQY